MSPRVWHNLSPGILRHRVEINIGPHLEGLLLLAGGKPLVAVRPPAMEVRGREQRHYASFHRESVQAVLLPLHVRASVVEMVEAMKHRMIKWQFLEFPLWQDFRKFLLHLAKKFVAAAVAAQFPLHAILCKEEPAAQQVFT